MQLKCVCERENRGMAAMRCSSISESLRLVSSFSIISSSSKLDPSSQKRSYVSRCATTSESIPARLDLSLQIKTHLIPHPKKVNRGGEDAFFISSYNGGTIAIADGVSGWAEKNVDPSLFSRELMANASHFIEDEEVNYNPEILIKKAHAATSSIGSATVIVAMLENEGILKIANVGDCGLRIFRKGQIIFSTSPVEHYFDCPFQLSSEAVGQTYLDATVCSVQLRERDIIVMGSDGVFDNVFDSEIAAIVTKDSNVAKELAELAHNHSLDPNYDSPYSIEARSRGFDVPWWKKLLGQKLTGGKLDDITVIVGQVVKNYP